MVFLGNRDYVLASHLDGLCLAMAKLMPGVSCNIESLQKDAETAEKEIKETDQEAKHLKDYMYR